MIILDTHVWLWWATGSLRLRESQRRVILEHANDRVGICTFSCWEIARLVADNQVSLNVGILSWFEFALNLPGVALLDMTPEIAIESNRLPGDFHRDPADQIIVATARIYQCPLATSDSRIRKYPHVETIY